MLIRPGHAPVRSIAAYPASFALRILRRFGSDVNVYLPGIGTFNGLAAENYIDSAGTTPAVVGQPVGFVGSALGTIDASQATVANQPILRSTSGKYAWDFDSTNDFLALDSVPYQLADDHCVIVGATTDTVAAGSKPLISNYGTGTRRCAQISVEASTLTATWTDNASTADTSPTGITVIEGVAFVATARKVGDAKELRKNGVSVNTSSTAAGATTLTNTSIGSDGTSFANGFIGPVVVINGTVSDTDLAILEMWIFSLTPGGPFVFDIRGQIGISFTIGVNALG